MNNSKSSGPRTRKRFPLFRSLVSFHSVLQPGGGRCEHTRWLNLPGLGCDRQVPLSHSKVSPSPNNTMEFTGEQHPLASPGHTAPTSTWGHVVVPQLLCEIRDVSFLGSEGAMKKSCGWAEGAIVITEALAPYGVVWFPSDLNQQSYSGLVMYAIAKSSENSLQESVVQLFTNVHLFRNTDLFRRARG